MRAGHLLGCFVVPASHDQSIFIKVVEGIVMNICVEIHPVGEACWIGGEPPAKGGIVVSSAKVHEVGWAVGPFGGKAPGADRFAQDLLVTEGAVAIDCRLQAYGCEECEVSLQIVDGGVDYAV